MENKQGLTIGNIFIKKSLKIQFPKNKEELLKFLTKLLHLP